MLRLPSNNAPLKLPSRGDTSSIILMLQEEMRQLKLKNEEQQREIRELRYELEAGRSKTFLPSDLKTGKELPRPRKDPNSPKSMIGRVFSPEVKGRGLEGRAVGREGGRAAVGRAGGEGGALEVALLEKQVKELQLKMLQMSNKLQDYDENFTWMQKFIDSFVHMAEELSVNYGGQLQLRGLTLRKKAKITWKYIKELINYLIK